MRKETIDSKAFSLLFIVFIFIGLGILIIVSIYLQPLEGDLTRMGGYAERDFGWNMPQEVVSNDTQFSGSYDKYYDLIVLGDSFSQHGMWQSYLTEYYNLTFTTLNWDNTTVEEIINNPIFKNNPPKLIIVETGVRTFPLHFSSQKETCRSSNASVLKGDLLFQFTEQHQSFVDIKRDIAIDWTKINLKFALLYIENSILRFLFNDDFTKVKKYALTKNDLFSNNKSGEILLLQTWLDAKEWSNDELSSAICSVVNIQNIVQSNGKTIFIILPIPDKGTAFAKYIINPKFRAMDYLPSMFLRSNINTPMIDVLLQKAIDSGDKDVYLPNDTHFGAKGYQLTAKSVYDLLLKLRATEIPSSKQ
ncbi:MAG: hypothetical protein NTX45_16165 [Proteobacteria bacterium]|nr:hypothetical protein [Pseudomonadota bacterium]